MDLLHAPASGETVETAGFRAASQGAWPGTQWDLTARESETVALLSTGMSNRDIAKALFLSENTVRTHLKAVFRKLSVSNRSQAVARALANPSYITRHPPLTTDNPWDRSSTTPCGVAGPGISGGSCAAGGGGAAARSTDDIVPEWWVQSAGRRLVGREGPGGAAPT